jgi:hypothetical protein
MLLSITFATTLAAGASPSPPERKGVVVTVKEESVDFLINGALVSRYQRGSQIAKPYLWPLHGPHGLPLTRAWPMEKGQPDETTDHVHQKSAWFCHGDVIPEGLTLANKIKGVEGVDFWSEAKGHGRIVCKYVGETEQDGKRGVVHTHNQWQTSDGQPVLEERRVIQLHDLGNAWLFVFEIDLEARHCPITFGDTKEGSFAIRINDSIREAKGGKLENAEGKVGEKECWGQMSSWCDYSGTIDGKKVGLAIFDDPTNKYPACWHSRGYGLMAANPFGRSKSGFPAMKGRTDLVKLARGEHLKLRYGILLHTGDAKEGNVAAEYEKFTKAK